MGTCSAGLWVLLAIFSISITQGALPRARFRRNVGTLLVTWQDVVDRNINSNGLGYLVEYKTTDGDKWIVYPSVVPYAENNALREIKIENLDSDASYQVRVKLVGKNGETIALSDGYTTAVWKDSSKCQQNEVSAPKAVKVRETTKYTLTVEFERPECGYPTSYVIEATGIGDALFEYHTETVARSPGTIIDLLPNTEYKIRVRAADSNHTERPWSETITASTVGDSLTVLGSITTDYRTNSEIRISWPIEYNEDLHKYKAYATAVDETSGKPSLTLDIKPTQNSALFTNLMPDTEYAIGVVAYGAAEPVFYYRASVKTASNNAMLWDDKPKINEFAPNSYIVSWARPDISHPIEYYVVEYRTVDNSTWLKYKTVISNDNQFTLDMVADDDTTFNSIRILAIDDQNRLVLKTPETRIGTVVVEPCTGYAGIPKNINYQFISDNAVQFSWDKPKCESWGPMTGYEYQFWESDSQNDDDQLESFVTDPVVVQGELKPDSEYSFRVRSRIGTVHSPWSDEITVRTDSFFPQGSVNLYRLRFITQPRSYLVWTPLTEDLERVTHFKLSYKEEGSDEWTEIVETPDSFKCPNDITFDVADYCYELSDPAIKTGVQYTANVLYETDQQQWSKKSDPVYFIIASTDPSRSVLYPILIGNIHLTRNGHQTEMHWSVSGNTENVEAYRIEIKRPEESAWRQIIGPIYHEPLRQSYGVELPRFSTDDYLIRILAVDDKGEVLATSPSYHSTSRCQVPSTAPTVRLEDSEEGIKAQWVYDEPVNEECHLRFLLSGHNNQKSFEFIVPGNSREFNFGQYNGGDWEVRVQAINSADSGPMSDSAALRRTAEVNVGVRTQRSVCDTRLDFWCRNQTGIEMKPNSAEALVSRPHIVENAGGKLIVEWSSNGDGRDVVGYLVEFRTKDIGWRSQGQYTPYVGNNRSYRQSLYSLQRGVTHYIRIQALDSSHNVRYVSPEIEAKTTCSSPTQAPLSPRISAPDSRHIVVSWIPPPPHTWQCNDVVIELQVQEPSGIGLVRIDKGKGEHVFDASPNQEWVVALRALNSVGSSPWSQTVTAKTPSAEEPIVGLSIVYNEEVPKITWRTKEGYDQSLGYYRLEWRPRGSDEWQKHGNQIPHFGWQRTYSVDLEVLTEAVLYDVRVKAFDNADNVIYTSPSISVQVLQRCAAPYNPPNDIQATPIGTSQVQLRWRPLPITDPRCAFWYVVEYSTPQYSGLQNVSMEKTQVLFDSRPFTKWTFRIQAANSMGESSWSEPISTQTFGAAPSAIYDLQVHPKSDSIYLSWQAPRDSGGQYMEYDIFYQLINRGKCEDGRNFSPNKVTTSNSSYTIKDLLPYSKYRVTITPRTKIQGRSYTQEIVTAEGAPSASPINVHVDNVRPTEVGLSWQPPPCTERNGEITDYEYELRSVVQPHSSPNIKNTGGPQTKLTIHGLNQLTGYTVRMRAYTHGGPGPWSEAKSFQTTQTQQIKPPVSVKVLKTGPDNAHVFWQDPKEKYVDKFKCRYTVIGRNDYKERQFPAYNPCSQEIVRSKNLPSLPDGSQFHCGKIDGLEKHKEYQFEVAAGSSTQNQWSEWSSVCSRSSGCDRKQDNRFNSSPKIINTYANSATLEWEAPTGDFTYFRIQYRELHGSWRNVKQISRAQTYGASNLYRTIINELPFSQTLSFRIVAVYPNNDEILSDETQTTTKCAPPPRPPDALNLDSVSPEETRITWARPARSDWLCDQIEYELSFRIGGRDAVKTLPGHITEWIIKTPPNVQVSAKIRTKNMVGQSHWSQEKTIMTRQGIPGPVQNLRLSARGPGEIFVAWESPMETRGKIMGYYVSYRLKYRLACRDDEPRDSSREYVTLPPLNSTEHLLSGLIPYAMYEVKVSAKTSEMGPEETREIATEPKAPSGPPVDVDVLSVTPTAVTFTWSEVECSMRLGPILSYEYEIIGQDDWAKMMRLVDNQTETTLRITDLIPYTKYIMRVRGFNSVGGGPFCEDKHFATAKAEAPLPPQDLLVSLEGTDFLSITWLPPYPPYGPHDAHKIQYRLNDSAHWNDWKEISKNANDHSLQCVNRGRLCYTIEGLQSGREYLIRVATKIEGGSFGPFCPEIVASTLQVLPDAPQRIAVLHRTDQSLNISWVPPIDSQHLKQYKVTVLESGGSPNDEKTYFVNHPKTTLYVERLEPETLYNISVAARADGDFGRSASAVFDTDIFKPPSLKQPPLITPDGANALDVFWKGLTDSKQSKWIKAYIIDYRPGGRSEFKEYGSMIPHDQSKVDYHAKIMRLNPDTLYYVRIKVADSKRVGEPGPEASAKTGCDKPALPPFNIRARSPASNRVVVNWEEPDYASWRCSDINYVIEYVNGTGTPKKISVARITEYTFDSLPNTAWTIRLLVNNSAGESEWSRKITITTAEGAPSIIDVLNVLNSDGKAVASWMPPHEQNGDITKYTVKYWLKSLGECGPQQGIPVIKEVTSPKLVVDDLVPDATYGFTVTAHTSLPGRESETFDYQTPQAAPAGSPKNVRVDPVTSRSANVLWNKPDCELRNGRITGYAGELKALDEWGNDEEAYGAAESALFENLIPFTAYKVRIKASNQAGEGPFSEWVQFTTLPEAPHPPSDLKEEDSFPEAIEISFVPPSPPFGVLSTYKIRSRNVGDERGMEKEVKVRKEELQCSDRAKKNRLCYRVGELVPEQKYEIDVAAYTENGGWSDYSKKLVARTHDQDIPVPEQPLRVTDEKAVSVTLEWDGLPPEKASHIIGYILEYKAADADGWRTYGDVIRHKPRQGKYRHTVKGLAEATEYFFHLKIVGVHDKKGAPGPDANAKTKCGRPEEPPTDIHVHSVGFDKVQLKWKKPDPETWKCDNVQYGIEYKNTTVPRDFISVSNDMPSELFLDALPGSKWEVRMRTETIEEGQKAQYSPWSDWKTLNVKSYPGEIFADVHVQSPTSAVITWDLNNNDRLWSHGVDVVAKLIKAAGCNKSDDEAIVKKNIYDKRIRLDGLLPGSEYLLTITPRRFTNSFGEIPKTVRKFTTFSDVPSGPPTNLHPKASKDTMIAFAWEPPLCHEQNGGIEEYIYSVEPVDNWNKASGTQESATKHLWGKMEGLMPGSTYRVKVRARTSAGVGPWSEHITIKTTGSEVDMPLDLVAIQTTVNSVSLAWNPPAPERAPVESYKVTHTPGSEGADSRDVQFNLYELGCSAFQPNPVIKENTLCGTILGLKPNTTYRFTVQGKSAASEDWGLSSRPHYATTRVKEDREDWGGIRLISASHDRLKVKWTPPEVIRNAVDKYHVNISVASSIDKSPKEDIVDAYHTEKEFQHLEPVTRYNITVQAYSPERSIWYAQGVFDTTDYGSGIVPWLTAPMDLSLYDKSDNMLHVRWNPPVLGEPERVGEITQYKVTIASYDQNTGRLGKPRIYTVDAGRRTIILDGLSPETIYNVTVQAMTDNGFGEQAWDVYSTLPHGQDYVLKLLDRTPTTLTLGWQSNWPVDDHYVLQWMALHSVSPHARLKKLHTEEIDSLRNNFTITDLEPGTTYNVSIRPKNQIDGAWGVFATLPFGWFTVKNLVWCAREDHAVSLKWDRVQDNLVSDYMIRYKSTKDGTWSHEESKAGEMLCPRDPDPTTGHECSKTCFLAFNLPHKSSLYDFHVRAKVNGVWNRWRDVGVPEFLPKPGRRDPCCIVPPVGFVEHIGSEGSSLAIDVSPVAKRPENITRYYVIVDERVPAGETNWTTLTDRRTASERGYNYYIAGSYSPSTLNENTKMTLGDGKVIGGYLNYPLKKGKPYSHKVLAVWDLDGKPGVVGTWTAQPYIAGWPWWWLLLLLLLLLLLILLTCCMLWCLQRRYRDKKQRRVLVGEEQTRPLLRENGDRRDMEENMHKLSETVGKIRSEIEQSSARNARGDFEDGYVRGFRDANKLGSASAARGFMHDEYGSRDDRFHEGYVKGLRDAGMTGMSTSMRNLCRDREPGGYSSGYMQGFRDGNSGVYGDRMSTNLLRRLDEQYPNQDEFHAGYIDGFKEGTSSRTSEHRKFEETRRLQESLTKLTEILQDKTKGGGDEIHTTKIYHVYNQTPEALSTAYSTTSAKHLEHELEELTSSSSRRNTLRKHYTPGDYLKYGSETDGYGSLGRNRRSLSVSALGRDTNVDNSRYQTGTGTSYISRSSAAERSTTDTFSRRYNYRSRSDMESPRRYASQTLLDGARPGPSTPHARRDALNTLQRELDTLSRSPDRSTPHGYSSDTGYVNESMRNESSMRNDSSMRSRTRGYSNYDYDSYQTTRSEVKTTSPLTPTNGTRSIRYPVSVPVRQGASSSYSYRKESGTSGVEAGPSSHNWPNDLTDIVNEPMGQTLERMKKYSSSVSQMDHEGVSSGMGDDGIKESIEERYQRSYKEEYTTGP